jgi:hypothetical protein
MENETTPEDRCKVYQNSPVYGMFIDLRLLIDDYHKGLNRAKELIREIARRLDEEREYERFTISARIKEILEDKIREGKITERWIEESLPSEYKRSYVKSELSSQLKKDKRRAGKAHAENKPKDQQKVESPRELEKILVTTNGTNFPSSQGLEKGTVTEYERLSQENKELKEALHLRDRESFSTADILQEGSIVFKIFRERFDELYRVMSESERFCYMIFDVKNRILLRAKSDISRQI